MNFELERWLVDYTYNVFNYFNGKINKTIPAKLNIRVNFDNDTLARNLFNNVNIYLWNIINYGKGDIYKIKYHIVFNIMHELSHIEQDIDYVKYSTDNQYVIRIEKENNYNTYGYIYHNLDKLSNELGVSFNNQEIYDNYKYYSNYSSYSTFTSLDNYYKRCLNTILHNDINKNNIDSVFSKYINIVFIMNDTKFIIKQEGVTNTYVQFFNNMIDPYNNMNKSASETTITEFDENTIYIVSTLLLSHEFVVE